MYRYQDGRVSGLIDLTDTSGVIYEWNSTFPGRCLTLPALKWLRDGGNRELTAYSMGLPPEPGGYLELHASYWLKMKDLGLVQKLIDDEGLPFDESFRSTSEFQGVPEEIDELYAYGRCMYLAAALNRLIGWPIRVATGDTPNAYIEHAWVCHDQSGMMFDIGGCYLELRNGWIGPDTVLLSNLSEGELLEVTRRTSGHAIPRAEWDAEVEQALAVVETHLRPQVSLAMSLGQSSGALEAPKSVRALGDNYTPSL